MKKCVAVISVPSLARGIYPSPTKILVSSLAFSHWKKLLHLPIGPCYSSVQKLPPMKKCVAVIPVPSLARGIEFLVLIVKNIYYTLNNVYVQVYK
jgi:hypothetical protein